MSRVHTWYFLTDSAGAPGEMADVSIFLAGIEEPCFIYMSEFVGVTINTTPQLKTNSVGYFEL